MGTSAAPLSDQQPRFSLNKRLTRPRHTTRSNCSWRSPACTWRGQEKSNFQRGQMQIYDRLSNALFPSLHSHWLQPLISLPRGTSAVQLSSWLPHSQRLSLHISLFTVRSTCCGSHTVPVLRVRKDRVCASPSPCASPRS